MMPQRSDPLHEADYDAIYAQGIWAEQSEKAHERLAMPRHVLQAQFHHAHQVEFHPDDVEALVEWEKQTHRNVAIWLDIMALIALLVVPYSPFFTAVVTLFLATMSLLFFIRSRLTHVEQSLRDLQNFQHRPMFQWTSASVSLSLSMVAYLFAVVVPYGAVSTSVQPLLFLVAMNFAMYTPLSIIRVVRQRSVRRKRVYLD